MGSRLFGSERMVGMRIVPASMFSTFQKEFTHHPQSSMHSGTLLVSSQVNYAGLCFKRPKFDCYTVTPSNSGFSEDHFKSSNPKTEKVYITWISRQHLLQYGVNLI